MNFREEKLKEWSAFQQTPGMCCCHGDFPDAQIKGEKQQFNIPITQEARMLIDNCFREIQAGLWSFSFQPYLGRDIAHYNTLEAPEDGTTVLEYHIKLFCSLTGCIIPSIRGT